MNDRKRCFLESIAYAAVLYIILIVLITSIVPTFLKDARPLGIDSIIRREFINFDGKTINIHETVSAAVGDSSQLLIVSTEFDCDNPRGITGRLGEFDESAEVKWFVILTDHEFAEAPLELRSRRYLYYNVRDHFGRLADEFCPPSWRDRFLFSVGPGSFHRKYFSAAEDPTFLFYTSDNMDSPLIKRGYPHPRAKIYDFVTGSD